MQCKKTKRIFIGLLVVITVFTFGLDALASSDNELVVLVEDLGGELWAPEVGGSGDKAIFALTNERPTSYPYTDQVTRIYPRLLEKWEGTNDGATWDLYIRKGIKFHDNWGELTAEDIKFTIEKIGMEGSENYLSWDFGIGKDKGLKSVEIIDPYHIRLNLNKPNVLVPGNLAYEEMCIVSKKYYDAVGSDKAKRHPVGTGPWRFIEHKPGEYIKYEAVENHWRQSPKYKYLTVKAIPEISTRLVMMKTGEADISAVPADRTEDLKKGGSKIKTVGSSLLVSLTLGGSYFKDKEGYDPTCPWVYHPDEPMDSKWNKRAKTVRQALNMSINRDAIISKIFNGVAQPSRLIGWPSGDNQHSDKWIPYSYNPEKAKMLMKQAGYEDGFEKPVIVNILNMPMSVKSKDVAMAIAYDWEQIGVKVERRNTEFATVRPLITGRKFAWNVIVDIWPIEFERWVVYSYIFSSSGGYCIYEDKKVDEYLSKLRSTLQFDKRIEIAKEMGDYFVEIEAAHGICTTDKIFALNPKINKWRVMPVASGISDFEYIE